MTKAISLSTPTNWEQRLAHTIVLYGLQVQPREVVLIRGTLITQTFMLALTQVLLEVGAQPIPFIEHPLITHEIYTHGNDEQVHWTSPLREQEVKCINAEIIIYAPMLPPTYFEQMTVDRRALMARNNLSNEAARLRSQRQERGEYRSIYVLYPTPVFSDTLQISLENLERAVLKGALIDTNDDSIEAWQQLQVEAQAWQRWLKDRQEIHIVAQGTDLRCSIKDRSFFSHIGHSLLPGGQLLTVPHTDSWQGYITFNTTMFFGTQRLSHVFIRFDHGRVVELYAAEGADMLQRALQTDVGASIIGEFGIGLNSHLDSLIGTVPFDELVRGTVHIAFGKSYPGAGATNHSMLHLDLIADLRSNGTVSVDEEKILVGGILALPD